MTKVLHVTFDMRIGGAEQVIYQLVRETDPKEFAVSVLCLDASVGPFGRQLEKQGYAVATCTRRPGFDRSLVWKIRRHILRHGIDVVHCHQYTPYVYGLLGALFTGRKVIFTEHGRFYPDQRRWKRVVLNPLFTMATDHITAISEATKDALVRFENFPRKKIDVIYNAIDDARFRSPRDAGFKESLGIKPDARVIGTVARLDPIKNHPMMIKALKLVQKAYPEVVLVIVGDGPERGNLERLAGGLGLTGSVLFPGFREDTHRFYGIMDLFLLTSFSEGTAMTLLEAMASSLPCIVTGVGGNAEIVEDGETAFVVPSNDEITLGERISTLLGSEELRRRMGEAGRRRFEDKFTVEKMVKEYEALYKKPS